jgi:hypothetical protein
MGGLPWSVGMSLIAVIAIIMIIITTIIITMLLLAFPRCVFNYRRGLRYVECDAVHLLHELRLRHGEALLLQMRPHHIQGHQRPPGNVSTSN